MWRLQSVSLGVLAWAAAVLPTMAQHTVTEPAAKALAEVDARSAGGRAAAPGASGVPVEDPNRPQTQDRQRERRSDAGNVHGPAAAMEDVRKGPDSGGERGPGFTPHARGYNPDARNAGVRPGYRRGAADRNEWPLRENRIYRAPRDAYGGRWIYVRPAPRYGSAPRFAYAGRGSGDNGYGNSRRRPQRYSDGESYRDDGRAYRPYARRDDDRSYSRGVPYDRPYDRYESRGYRPYVRGTHGHWEQEREQQASSGGDFNRYPYNIGRRRDF